MAQQRVQPGVPTGGQYAAVIHGDVGTNALTSDPSGGYMPLAELREKTQAAVVQALSEIDNNAMIDAARLSDFAFPQGEHARAVHSLQALRSELTGDPAPAPPSAIEAQYRAYEAQVQAAGTLPEAGIVGGQDRSLKEMRAHTATAVNDAIALLNSRYVSECRGADGAFPADAYSTATQTLQSLHQRLLVDPVRPVGVGDHVQRPEVVTAPWPSERDMPFRQHATGLVARIAADDRYAAWQTAV